MQRTFVTFFAFALLLAQPLLSVGAGAVLCIKTGEEPCGEQRVPAECTCCCTVEEEPAETVIQLCTPCHDGCSDCIEVELPTQTLPTVVNAKELPPVAFLGMALAMEHTISEACASESAVGQGTGPPKVPRNPDERVIESTILLM